MTENWFAINHYFQASRVNDDPGDFRLLKSLTNSMMATGGLMKMLLTLFLSYPATIQ